MNFLEKDLEEIIFNADKSKLTESGLCVNEYETFYRQLRIGNYGVADIVSHDRPFYNKISGKHVKGHITVYELKKDKISVSAFLQALNYLNGIQSYLNIRRIKHNYDYTIRLIGRDYNKNSSFQNLPDIIYCDNHELHIGCNPIFSIELYTYTQDNYGLLTFTQIKGEKLQIEGF